MPGVGLIADKTSFVSSGLAASTGYTYRIKLTNYKGASLYSNEVAVTTPAVGSDVTMAGLRLWLRSDLGLPASGAIGSLAGRQRE